MRIGVLAVQGAFAEHEEAFQRAFDATKREGEVVEVRTAGPVATLDALAIPGGESTTIAKLMLKTGIHDAVRQRARDEDLPILGTCAGLIMLAKEGGEQVLKTGTRLLGLMDMRVDRNAFGRQRESFEAEVRLAFLPRPFHAVFIRAPAITSVHGACKELGRLDSQHIIAAREGNRLALAFHPELTGKPEVHSHFLAIVEAWKQAPQR